MVEEEDKRTYKNGQKCRELLNKLKIEKIKEEILGKDYDLSVAFVSENKIKSLNKNIEK